MPMESNRYRFSGSPRKRSNVKSQDDPADVAILSMAVDSESVFRRKVPGLLSGRKTSAVDDAFHTLLSEANQELASLLQDVRAKASGRSLGDAQSQQVSELLIRAVRCAAKQYTLQAELGSLALTDELTGLYNRRGFMALAERQLKLGRRSGRGMLLIMMDVDHLKQINDSFGHLEGDCALKRTADVLEETFRDSDVVARLDRQRSRVACARTRDEADGRTDSGGGGVGSHGCGLGFFDGGGAHVAQHDFWSLFRSRRYF